MATHSEFPKFSTSLDYDCTLLFLARRRDPPLRWKIRVGGGLILFGILKGGLSSVAHVRRKWRASPGRSEEHFSPIRPCLMVQTANQDKPEWFTPLPTSGSGCPLQVPSY